MEELTNYQKYKETYQKWNREHRAYLNEYHRKYYAKKREEKEKQKVLEYIKNNFSFNLKIIFIN
ncbi:hypothetical protein HDV06_001368 [Boothiomyces sp. JEL0866]|nr:hypothetical protein HDV06_001368 [Boothiomyces sp. JEL0866]